MKEALITRLIAQKLRLYLQQRNILDTVDKVSVWRFLYPFSTVLRSCLRAHYSRGAVSTLGSAIRGYGHVGESSHYRL